MKRLNHKRLIAAAYLIALVLWLVQCTGSLAQGAWYRHKGLAPSMVLGQQELEFTSTVPYKINGDEQEGWIVTTDADPHIYWNQQVWLDTVILDVSQNKPTGGVELYYRSPGQEDFDARQVIYPSRDAEGRYIFELGGKLVDAIRIDPDSVGGVLTEFRGVAINPPHAWYRHFMPSMGQWLLLILLPLAGAALVSEAAALMKQFGLSGHPEPKEN